MKHIHTFESFLNEAETSGPYYLQVNLRQSMLGGHSIDAEVASSGTQDFADIRDKSGFLKTPALDKAMTELKLWKSNDKSGKIDASFIKEFEKRMQDTGFKLAKFKYSSPLVKQVADEAEAVSAIKETIKTLDTLYNSYTPELVPVQPGPASSVRASVDNLVNNYVSGRGDVVSELARFLESAVGSKVTKYLKHGPDDNTAIEKVRDQYSREKPAKEESWGVLKACIYKDGTAIVWIEDPKKTATPEYLTDYSAKNLSYNGVKPGDAVLVVKK
jgi:archaellum component FlaC